MIPPTLRPVRRGDTASLWELLEPAGPELIGMSSLPVSAAASEEACADSGATLSALATGSFELAPGARRRLLFILEDGDDRPLGLTGVTFKRAYPNLAVEVATSDDGLGLVMASSSVPWTRTELDSTYLARPARGRGLGTLVSRGRFLFLHLVASQIPSTIASHLRGRFDDDGSAPFWSCFGAQFASWSSSTEAELALWRDPSLLDGLAGHRLPLTAKALGSLGPVNAASLPAFHLLRAEGLAPNGMYDPIDGGPTLVADIAATVSGRLRVHGRARIAGGPDPDTGTGTGIGPDTGTGTGPGTGTGTGTGAGNGTDRPPDPVDGLVSVAGIDRFRVARAVIVADGPTITIDPPTATALRIEDDALLAAAPLDTDDRPRPGDRPVPGARS